MSQTRKLMTSWAFARTQNTHKTAYLQRNVSSVNWSANKWSKCQKVSAKMSIWLPKCQIRCQMSTQRVKVSILRVTFCGHVVAVYINCAVWQASSVCCFRRERQHLPCSGEKMASSLRSHSASKPAYDSYCTVVGKLKESSAIVNYKQSQELQDLEVKPAPVSKINYSFILCKKEREEIYCSALSCLEKIYC